MSAKPSLYREVFGSPQGREVFADMCAYIERMDVSQPGSAGKLIAHIARMREINDPAAANGKTPTPRAAGGRIQHG